MNRKTMDLFASFVFLIVMQACNRKVESTAVKSEGTTGPVAKAPATPPTSDRDLIEAIPPVSSREQVPKQAALGVPKKAFQFQDAFFDYDKALLHPEDKAKLQENAKILKEHPEMKMVIEGHCDERGTTEYNLALGNRRAEAAKQYLINLGVQPSQLSTISYGKEKPFCFEHNEACFRENRRAHFVSATEAN